MAKSFIESVSPHRPKSRAIPWPLGGAHKVLVRMLGDVEREEAYFATRDHFDAMKVEGPGGKRVKRQVDTKDPAFENRERVELVFRAFRVIDDDGTHTDESIASSVDELAKQPGEVIDALYLAWAEFQKEAAAKPVDQKTARELVEHLKKNTPVEALLGLPSSWLIAVIRILVDPSSTSPTSSDSG